MIQTKKREASLIRSNWKWLYSAQKFNRLSISFQSAMVRSFLLISLTIVLQGKVYKSFEIIFCMNKALNMRILNIKFHYTFTITTENSLYFQCYMYIDKYVERNIFLNIDEFLPIFFFGCLVFFGFVLSHYWLIFSIYFIFALDDICRKKNTVWFWHNLSKKYEYKVSKRNYARIAVIVSLVFIDGLCFKLFEVMKNVILF